MKTMGMAGEGPAGKGGCCPINTGVMEFHQNRLEHSSGGLRPQERGREVDATKCTRGGRLSFTGETFLLARTGRQ